MYRFILVAVSIGRLTNAFDMEHYTKPYQAARKEYTEALREVRLTEGAYRASKGAYIAASETYNDNLDDERKEEHDIMTIHMTIHMITIITPIRKRIIRWVQNQC